MESLLPSPVFEENLLWVDMYWRAWKLAFRNFRQPTPRSGFVAPFVDAAFNDNIFLWDSCFITLFCNLAHPLVPGIAMLDNFYAKQHDSGEICREIQRESGLDFPPWVNEEDHPLFSRWGWHFPDRRDAAPVSYRERITPRPNPHLTLDALNHPIAAWVELESCKVTGDTDRLRRVWVPLARYYRALNKYLTQGNGLYVTDWASMDNSPRNASLAGGGTGIDISSEMVLFARSMAEIAGILGRLTEARRYQVDADDLAERINRLMWSADRKFFFDLAWDGKLINLKTIAGFWTLLAKVASPAQAKCLTLELKNTQTFCRSHPVPTLAADEVAFRPEGCYWRGGVWTAMNVMIIRGLELYGYHDLSHEIAFQHLSAVAEVFRTTGSIFEMYAPDASGPGLNALGERSIADFVGMSGITPILLLMEQGIGLRPDAPINELVWRLRSDQRCGCARYRFNGHLVDLSAEPADNGTRRLTIRSTGAFLLRLIRHGSVRTLHIDSGMNGFNV